MSSMMAITTFFLFALQSFLHRLDIDPFTRYKHQSASETSRSTSIPTGVRPLELHSHVASSQDQLLQTQVSPYKTLCAHAQYTSALLHCTSPFHSKLPTGLYQWYILSTPTKVSWWCFTQITFCLFQWRYWGPNSHSKSFALTWKIPRSTLSDLSKSSHFFSSVAKWGIYFGSKLLSLAVRAKVQHAQTVHLHGLLPKQLAFQQQSRPFSNPEAC